MTNMPAAEEKGIAYRNDKREQSGKKRRNGRKRNNPWDIGHLFVHGGLHGAIVYV